MPCTTFELNKPNLIMLTKRQFIGRAGSAALGLLASSRLSAQESKNSRAPFLFIEAEGFADQGGWELDQQSMEQMGSPYLLAHGLGIPVKDATADVVFPEAGEYRIWVRTRDWVAPWRVAGAPGRFQVLIDGQPVKETFGTKNADWHWHDGGVVTVPEKATLALHDLTGFEGRCEAVFFCKNTKFKPTNNVKSLEKFRRKLLNLPEKPSEGGSFDLVVTGAGLAGICSAISAARNGLKVALIQDRPVLGGNASSEVRVWPEGKTNVAPYPRIGDIVKEILPPMQRNGRNLNGVAAKYYDDSKKFKIVKNESNITIFTDHRAIAVEKKGSSISAVIVQSTRSGIRQRLHGKFFADCTGDAVIGYKAGANYEFSVGNNMGSSNLWRPLDASKKEEVLKCECKDKDALTANFKQGKTAQPFPRCPWAIDLSKKPFPGRKNFKGQWGGKDPLSNLGGWFWESGFDKDPIEDVERIRDLNFRAMYGAWDALKNTDGLYPNHRLGWAAFIAGKRESRRLLGDVILTANDFRKGKKFDDPAFPCSWHIDLHTPHESFDKGLKGDEFISRASTGEEYSYKGPYWAPYRTLYSRNIPNLFMAGRDISVSKDGLGPVRVMRTTGMMGEVVGMAASLCVKHQTTPRGVYKNHLKQLQALMKSRKEKT